MAIRAAHQGVREKGNKAVLDINGAGVQGGEANDDFLWHGCCGMIRWVEVAAIKHPR